MFVFWENLVCFVFLKHPFKNLTNIFNKFTFLLMGSSNLKLVKLMYKMTQFKYFANIRTFFLQDRYVLNKAGNNTRTVMQQV